jgi:hypothetical protein
VRFHGRGTVVEAGAAGFDELAAHFPNDSSARAVIRVDVARIADTCGYGVPLYRYEGQRDQLGAWAARQGADGLRAYRAENNARSLDGLAGLAKGDA